jgi:hypothetical protein
MLIFVYLYPVINQKTFIKGKLAAKASTSYIYIPSAIQAELGIEQPN